MSKEKEDNNLVVKLDLNKESNREFLAKGLQTKILESAVNLLLQELTPERMQLLMGEMLSKAVGQSFEWEIQKHVTEMRKPIIEAYMKNPVVREAIRVNTEKGLTLMIEKIPEALSEDVTEHLIQQIKERFELVKRRT